MEKYDYKKPTHRISILKICNSPGGVVGFSFPSWESSIRIEVPVKSDDSKQGIFNLQRVSNQIGVSL